MNLEGIVPKQETRIPQIIIENEQSSSNNAQRDIKSEVNNLEEKFNEVIKQNKDAS